MAQELSTKMMEKLPENQVRPFETKTVYATGEGGFLKEGEKLELHPLHAATLLNSGRATETAPAKKSK